MLLARYLKLNLKKKGGGGGIAKAELCLLGVSNDTEIMSSAIYWHTWPCIF